MIKDAYWISPANDYGTVCPSFVKTVGISKEIEYATLTVTATGVYDAFLNGNRIGDYILAPGCTVYEKRLQYQTYDITAMLNANASNELVITVGTGWFRGHISSRCDLLQSTPCAVIAEISINYTDGSHEQLITDESWHVRKSNVLFSDIYDGESCDATLPAAECENVIISDITKDTLILQEGEIIREHERIKPLKYIISPKGERIIDFGQNLAGYVELTLNAAEGTLIRLSCAEILDSDGNFYTDNYRGAKACFTYICRNGMQTIKPRFTFFGFRYIRLDEYPDDVNLNAFTAVAVYSDMKRTGYIESSNAKLNQLFSNTLWSQRSNFIDIPTDCPQRDERMGWTGDAQVFCKTACYNYDVKKFFEKWMKDVCAAQLPNGCVAEIVPNFWKAVKSGAAWGDAITIIPWQIYMHYGDLSILQNTFDGMKKWVDFITNDSLDKYLWTCSDYDKELWHNKHYGDWLALDAPYGSYKGATDDDFIASAFYSHSVKLLVKAGALLGKDMSGYEELYRNIVSTFKKRFSALTKQTEHVLALYFDLTDDKPAVASELVRLIRQNGSRLNTGFVGTPYLLHALSDNGYPDVAYDLLLQEAYPSWLYEVNHGATTIWEHWDGIRDDGTLWSKGMNSYNHYAYGSVFDWVYTKAAGIQSVETAPGFKEAVIAPLPDKRLTRLNVQTATAYGIISSKWTYQDTSVKYEISTPVPSRIIIDGREYTVGRGDYVFYSKA